MSIDEQYLTVADVARILKLNQQTVRNWIDQGRLPALDVGRRVRIRRSDLDKLIEDSYTATPTKRADSDARPSIWDGFVPAPQVPGAD